MAPGTAYAHPEPAHSSSAAVLLAAPHQAASAASLIRSIPDRPPRCFAPSAPSTPWLDRPRKYSAAEDQLLPCRPQVAAACGEWPQFPAETQSDLQEWPALRSLHKSAPSHNAPAPPSHR